MGETTYLMQPFSFTSGISHQLKESISFGRFMTEPLAWEKWSVFSHKKYVEEAEKFTRPGSVAQLKAFFEARYRNPASKKEAKATDAAATSAATTNYNNTTAIQVEKNEGAVLGAVTIQSSLEDVDGQIGIKETGQEAIVVSDDNEEHMQKSTLMEVDALSQIRDFADDGVEVHELCGSRPMEKHLLMEVNAWSQNRDVEDDGVEVQELGCSRPTEKHLLMEVYALCQNQDVADDGVEVHDLDCLKPMEKPLLMEVNALSQNQAHADDCVEVHKLSCSKPMKKPLLMEVGALSQNQAHADDCVEVHELSCPRPTKKPPLKDFISNGEDDNRVLISKKRSAASMLKPLITARPTKVLPLPARATASLQVRKESSATPISEKTTKDWLNKRGPITIPTQKSVNLNLLRETNLRTSSIMGRLGSSKAISRTESSKTCSTLLRTETKVYKQLDHRKSSATLQTVNPRCSKLRSSSRDKTTQSTIFTSPFRFRTEERAAKRKEKLEERFKVDWGKKAQQQETLKHEMQKKAETESELKRLGQRHCFKARPLPDFYKERRPTKDHMEKGVTTHPQPPRRKPAPPQSLTSQTRVKMFSLGTNIQHY